MTTDYPESAAARSAWIRSRRPPSLAGDPWRPQAWFREEERAASGELISVATVLLTNRECPWHCLMCDLWRGMLRTRVPAGAIAAQLDFALAQVGPARQLKLYNSGSFFDAGAIPPEEHDALAERVRSFERVIVECHPALAGDSCLRFRDRLAKGPGEGRRGPELEVAMGLETVHPVALERLNKRMTLDQFARAAAFLARHGIAMRAFVLVQPPFVPPTEAVVWAARSVDFAFACGASVVSLIPTRPGNGALDALQAQGVFAPPALATLEAAAAYGVGLGRGRVFADLWDLERFATCGACFPRRRERLQVLNTRQEIPPPVLCAECAGAREPGLVLASGQGLG
ncbi:MAG: radical SAM protein [Verrucomicrobia bacterium]|nr:radical SAM protein [Verrucomicrobiota bacterium]